MNTKSYVYIAIFAVCMALFASFFFTVDTANAAATDCNFTRNLFRGVYGEDVRCLQTHLNGAGFKISDFGFGSPGSETTYFGPLTQNAVSLWQAAESVSPIAGYFGPFSRAKYKAVIASVPPTTPSPITLPPLATGGAVVTAVPVSSQPASTLIPQNAARVPFVQMSLIANPDQDVTIRSITVELRGFANTAALDRVMLIDENRLQIGNTRSFNTNRQAVFTESFILAKGTTRTITAAADAVSSLSAYQGQSARIAVVAIEAETATQTAFPVPIDAPIVGNDMTFNSTLSIGSLNGNRGTTDPGSAQTKEVGGSTIIFAAVRVTAGSEEDVLLEGARFTQSGSAAPSDLANVKVVADNTSYSATVGADGKTYTSLFSGGITIPKGNTKEIAITGDITGGSLRTIDFDIQKKTDIIAKGKTFGYYITASGGSSGSAAEGNFSSDREPFYNGFTLTISQGNLNIERSNTVTAGNIAVEISNTALGAFSMEARGEPIQISKIVLTFTVTGSGAATNISNIAIYDENGRIVTGPRDATATTVTFSDSLTVPSGKHTYTVRGKLSTAFANGDTVTVSLTPSSDITARGETTGNTVTAAPSSSVSASKQTVRGSSLVVSVATSPSPQTVVKGVSSFIFARYVFDASASGEDIRVSSLKLRDTYASAGATNLSNCRLMDGAAVLTTGGNSVDPSLDGTSPDDITFRFDTPLIVTKGALKTISLACNISNSATTASTHAWGINSGVSGSVSATGATSGATITPSVITDTGSTMTIAANGSLAITLDASSPSERYALSGKTDTLISMLKLEAQNEDLKINKIALILTTATAGLADVSKVSVWDGTAKVGEGVITASNGKVTIRFTQDFIVPKDSTKQLSVRADLAALGINQPGTSGHLIAINYNGTDVTETEAIGQGSGQTINPPVGSNTNAGGIRLVKTYPTLELLSIPSNTLVNGSQTLYRFKVTADAANDSGLYKFTFLRTVSGVTLSDFSLYAFTNTEFSNAAYSWNTVNRTPASADINGYVEIYFDPVNGAGNEAIHIPKGETRYFELAANVSGASSGDSASISLQGDSAYYASGYSGTATAIDADTNDNVIWSPDTTTTSVPATSDWLNGYRLPGLASTGLTTQTLSR